MVYKAIRLQQIVHFTDSKAEAKKNVKAQHGSQEPLRMEIPQGGTLAGCGGWRGVGQAEFTGTSGDIAYSHASLFLPVSHQPLHRPGNPFLSPP